MPLVNNPGGIRVVKHEQTVPSAVWSVYHGINAIPSVDLHVWENGTLMKAFPTSISYPSNDVAIINWSVPRTGFATLA
jgi:hypothetical protein